MHAVPEGKLRMRRKAVTALAAHKQEGLQQLKDDPDEMLRGQATCNQSFGSDINTSSFGSFISVQGSDLYCCAIGVHAESRSH